MLHRITGLGAGDLDGLAYATLPTAALTASQAALADELAAAVRAVDGRVLVRLDGADADTRRALVVTRLAAALGGGVLAVRDAVAAERDAADTAAVLDREARARRAAHRAPTTRELLALLEAEVVVTDDAGPRCAGRVTLARTVPLPTAAEEAALWRAALDVEPDADPAAIVVAERELVPALPPARRGRRRGRRRVARPRRRATSPSLRRLVRERSRTGFGALAQRIEPRATWDDLVLPDGQRELLREIEQQRAPPRARATTTGASRRRSERGLGVTALFAGESGTGKTMAAEVLAGVARARPLPHRPLGGRQQVHRRDREEPRRACSTPPRHPAPCCSSTRPTRSSASAARCKDSHDRYANLEVAYLLQRMEAYRGLAILTTNLRGNVDRAFLRRIRFVVQFPFPDEASRAEIWRRSSREATPTEGLDPVALARLQLSGGAIRAIALSAAFAAADAGTPIRPAHLLRAATVEAAKSRALADGRRDRRLQERGCLVTEYRIHIDSLVLRDVPAEWADGLDRALERAVAAAAAAQPSPGAIAPRAAPASDRESFTADLGRQIWTSVRGGTP